MLAQFEVLGKVADAQHLRLGDGIIEGERVDPAVNAAFHPHDIAKDCHPGDLDGSRLAARQRVAQRHSRAGARDVEQHAGLDRIDRHEPRRDRQPQPRRGAARRPIAAASSLAGAWPKGRRGSAAIMRPKLPDQREIPRGSGIGLCA